MLRFPFSYSALMQKLNDYLRSGMDDIAKRRAKYNLQMLKTLDSLSSEEWDPTMNLGIKQAEKTQDTWERLAQLVLAPDLAAKSSKRLCSGGKEAERKKLFEDFMPAMEKAGWSIKIPFLRFWEGERSKEAMLRGLTGKNDIELVTYVFDKFFRPLLNRKILGNDADDYFQEHKVKLTRIVQLTSSKTFDNGSMRFQGKGLVGERETVKKMWLHELEDAGFHLKDRILSLWSGERDREKLVGGLDQLSQVYESHLLSLLLFLLAGKQVCALTCSPPQSFFSRLFSTVSRVCLQSFSDLLSLYSWHHRV